MAAWKGVTLALAAASLLHPASALADGVGHSHDAAAAGGGDVPPVVATAEATPAPGAQPARPADVAVPAVEAPVGNANAAVDTSREDEAAALGNIAENTANAGANANHAGHAANAAVQPVAAGAPAPVASGGGTADDATSATAAPAAAPTGSGELPFTGPEDNILIIALAGMFAPIGVLLWCAARRSEHRWLRRHLAMPRFEWSER